MLFGMITTFCYFSLYALDTDLKCACSNRDNDIVLKWNKSIMFKKSREF